MITIFSNHQTLLITFFWVLLGAVFNDYNNSIHGDEDIYFFRIIMISTIITALMYGFSKPVLNSISKLGNNGAYYFLCAAAGWANYKFYDLLNITGKGFFHIISKKIEKEDNNV